MESTGARMAALACGLLGACSIQPDQEAQNTPARAAQADEWRDHALAEKVRRRLGAGAPSPSLGIEITADRGVVGLHGTVHSPAERQRLALAAAAVGGVKRLDNRLQVHPVNDTSTGR